MEIVKVRKARSSNLSAVERAILAELCSKYSWIVENKQTDSGSAKTKEAGWQQLAVEFVGAGGQPREWLQLKHAFDNMKQRAKKAASHDKSERHRTGGGTYVEKVDSVDEKILAILGNRAQPLVNPYDSDAIYNNESVMCWSNPTADAANSYLLVHEPSDSLPFNFDQGEGGVLISMEPVLAAEVESLSRPQIAPADQLSLIPSTSTAEPPTKTASGEVNVVGTSRVKGRRPWAKQHRVRGTSGPTPTAANDEAARKIEALVDFKREYYSAKLVMKRQQHDLLVKEHEKRMKVLDLEEKLYERKLSRVIEQ